MADLSITAANVSLAAGGAMMQVTAGGAVTRGQPVRKDTADNRYVPAQGNSIAGAAVVGVALNDAADGQPLTVAVSGDLTIGATLSDGQVYVVSAASAGGIAPVTDLVSTNVASVVGVATSTAVLKLGPLAGESRLT